MHEWQVDRVEEFDEWWNELDESEQIDVNASIKLLRALGPTLPFPHCSGITQSRHAHMRVADTTQRETLSCFLRIRSSKSGSLVDWRR